MINICISVTSHALDPLPLSQTVTPSRTPSPLERDVLYGRSLRHVAHFVRRTSVNYCLAFDISALLCEESGFIHPVEESLDSSLVGGVGTSPPCRTRI